MSALDDEANNEPSTATVLARLEENRTQQKLIMPYFIKGLLHPAASDRLEDPSLQVVERIKVLASTYPFIPTNTLWWDAMEMASQVAATRATAEEVSPKEVR